MPRAPSVRLFVRRSVCPSARRSIGPSVVGQSDRPSVRRSVDHSVGPLVRPPAYFSVVRPFSVRPSVGLTTRRSVGPSVCRPAHCSSVCRYVRPSARLSIRRSVCPGVGRPVVRPLSVHSFVRPPVNPPTSLSVRRSVRSSVRPCQNYRDTPSHPGATPPPLAPTSRKLREPAQNQNTLSENTRTSSA